MRRYFYFYLSGLNGLPDPFANIGFVEEISSPKLESNAVVNTDRFNKLCKLNHIKNSFNHLLSSHIMEF